MLPKAMRASLVYIFRRAQGTSEYVGSTTCIPLHSRVAENAGMSFSTGITLIVPFQSTIRTNIKHIQTCNSPIFLDYFNIKVSASNNAFDLRIS